MCIKILGIKNLQPAIRCFRDYEHVLALPKRRRYAHVIDVWDQCQAAIGLATGARSSSLALAFAMTFCPLTRSLVPSSSVVGAAG